MKCEFSREKLIGFFYDELAAHEKAKVEKHLKTCASCQEEVQHLTQTTRVLQASPDEEPQLNLRFVEPARRIRGLDKLVSRPVGIGLVAGVVVAVLLLAVLNFEATYAEGDLSIKFSLFPQPSQPVTTIDDSVRYVTRPQFEAWKEAQVTMVEDLLAEVESRQRRESRLLLTELLQDIERQRQQDLRVVGRGLEAVQFTNEDRFRRTSAVLNQLLMQASYTGGDRDSSRNE